MRVVFAGVIASLLMAGSAVAQTEGTAAPVAATIPPFRPRLQAKEHAKDAAIGYIRAPALSQRSALPRLAAVSGAPRRPTAPRSHCAPMTKCKSAKLYLSERPRPFRRTRSRIGDTRTLLWAAYTACGLRRRDEESASTL